MQLLDNEVMKIIAAAQPRVMERSSPLTRRSSHLDHSPGHSHSAQRDDGIALTRSPQGFGQGYDGLGAELMNLSAAMPMPMSIPDVAWSPALADEIGWDWGDFGQLFTEQPM